MNNEITIVIAGGHPIYRKGLLRIIENTPGLRAVGEADHSVAALELIRAHRPRVVVLDVGMPGKDGVDLTQTVIEKEWPVEVVFLAADRDEKFFNAALDLGVKGLAHRDDGPDEIINCIRSAAAGKSFVSPLLMSSFLSLNLRDDAPGSEEPSAQPLTPMERRILNFIAEYKTNREIAEQLFISVRTVENHRHNISQKLNIRGPHALLRFALNIKSELS
ncbi:MAG: response regulator [Blastocatellales bacterium]